MQLCVVWRVNPWSRILEICGKKKLGYPDGQSGMAGTWCYSALALISSTVLTLVTSKKKKSSVYNVLCDSFLSANAL